MRRARATAATATGAPAWAGPTAAATDRRRKDEGAGRAAATRRKRSKLIIAISLDLVRFRRPSGGCLLSKQRPCQPNAEICKIALSVVHASAFSSCQEVARLPQCWDGAQHPVDRPVLRLSRRRRAGEPRGAARSPGAGDRRARHRQGADRRAPPPSVVALGRALGNHELRRSARDTIEAELAASSASIRVRARRRSSSRPRPVPARRQMVEALGDQFLAGAALADTSTGRSSGAARLARSTASRNEVDWPTSWVLRSIRTVGGSATSWQEGKR